MIRDACEDQVTLECPRCGGVVRVAVENGREADRRVSLLEATLRQLRAVKGRQMQCDGCDSMVWVAATVEVKASAPVDRPEPIPTGSGGYFYGNLRG